MESSAEFEESKMEHDLSRSRSRHCCRADIPLKRVPRFRRRIGELRKIANPFPSNGLDKGGVFLRSHFARAFDTVPRSNRYLYLSTGFLDAHRNDDSAVSADSAKCVDSGCHMSPEVF